MTINSKDIEALVELHCYSISFTELSNLLKKLDYEGLETLWDIMDEVYESGRTDGVVDNDRYEEGYSDGYYAGLSEGE